MISLYRSWHRICRESPGPRLLPLPSPFYTNPCLFLPTPTILNRGQAHDAIFDHVQPKMPCFIAYLVLLLYTRTFLLFSTFLGYRLD